MIEGQKPEIMSSHSELPKMPAWEGQLAGNEIGRGANSIVYKVKRKEGNESMALKLIKLPTDPSDKTETIQNLQSEAGIMSVLQYTRHPALPKFYGFEIGKHQEDAVLAMEYLGGKNLFDQKQEKGPFSEEEIKSIIASIGGALARMHFLPEEAVKYLPEEKKSSGKRSLVHLDIKPENIIANSDPERPYVLLDCGTNRPVTYTPYSKDRSKDTRQLDRYYTPPYGDPVYLGNGFPQPYSDVYSFAATILQLGLKEDLPPKAFVQLEDYIAKTNFSPELKDLLKRSLSWDSTIRPQDMREFLKELPKDENDYFRIHADGFLEINLKTNIELLEMLPYSLQRLIDNIITDYNQNILCTSSSQRKNEFKDKYSEEISLELRKLRPSKFKRKLQGLLSILALKINIYPNEDLYIMESDVATINEAEKIMGKDFIGPSEIEKALNIAIWKSDTPPFPFSREDLEQAKKLNQFLIMRLGRGRKNVPLTLREISEEIIPGFNKRKRSVVEPWSAYEDFFVKEKLKSCWALVSKDAIPNSTGSNYIQQIDDMVDYLQNQVFKGISMPEEYREAIDEYHNFKPEILIAPKVTEILHKLKITQLTRRLAVEVYYDNALYFLTRGKILLPNYYIWTKSRSSDDEFIAVRFNNYKEIDFSSWRPVSSDDELCATFSRTI